MLTMIVLALAAGGGFMQDAPLSQAKIGQVALTVTDLGRARDFYGTKLGLPLTMQTETMLFFDCGGTTLMLSLPEETVPVGPSGAVVYFSVDRIAARYASLEAAGARLEREPHPIYRTGDRELWMAFFRDPDGHLLALMNWQ